VVAIEGVWGLGSALVSGDVTPDSFTISKITGEITTRRVSPKIKTHTRRPNERVAPRRPPPKSPLGEDRAVASPSLAKASAPADSSTQVDSSTPAELRDAPCLTDDEIRALAAIARRVETHYGAAQDIEWALLDPEDTPDAPPTTSPLAAPRIVLLQSRPETVWAAKDVRPAGASKPRPADHVLTLFGKPR
jgi:pyruvate, water dikinase